MEKYYLMAIHYYNFTHADYMLNYLKDYKLQKLIYFLLANNYNFKNNNDTINNLIISEKQRYNNRLLFITITESKNSIIFNLLNNNDLKRYICMFI